MESHGLDRTDHNLGPHSPKKSVSMLRKIYEDKIRETEKSSSKANKSVKRYLNVEDVATSSEDHGVKEKKIAVMKATLDSFGKRLSRLNSIFVTLYDLCEVKGIGEDIEIFDKEHSAYIYGNCKVDHAIIDVQKQFESLRKEYQERRTAVLKARLEFLGEELSDLGRRRQSGLARSDCVNRVKRIEDEIGIFDKEHSSYIEHNCEVNSAIMDIRRQFESLQKEYQEKKQLCCKQSWICLGSD